MFCRHFTKVLSHVENSRGHWWRQTDIILNFDEESGPQINYHSPKRLDILGHKIWNHEQLSEKMSTAVFSINISTWSSCSLHGMHAAHGLVWVFCADYLRIRKKKIAEKNIFVASVFFHSCFCCCLRPEATAIGWGSSRHLRGLLAIALRASRKTCLHLWEPRWGSQGISSGRRSDWYLEQVRPPFLWCL